MAENIVILTGAGISAESGIKTFGRQTACGKTTGSKMGHTEAFFRNPLMVQQFYNTRRSNCSALPSSPMPRIRPWHGSKRRPGQVLLITQNIDNLHERAGSRSLIHMHGELLKGRCQTSGGLLEIDHDLTPALLPLCGKPLSAPPCGVVRGNAPANGDDLPGAGPV